MTNKNEEILKKLMKETETFRAPAGFTSNVMQRIKAEEAGEEDLSISWIFSPRYWVLIGLGMGIAVAFLFSYDLPFISDIFASLEPRNLSNLSWNFINVYQGFLHDLQMSSSTFIIIGSVVALFLLDRILRKRFTIDFFSF